LAAFPDVIDNVDDPDDPIALIDAFRSQSPGLTSGRSAAARSAASSSSNGFNWRPDTFEHIFD